MTEHIEEAARECARHPVEITRKALMVLLVAAMAWMAQRVVDRQDTILDKFGEMQVRMERIAGQAATLARLVQDVDEHRERIRALERGGG